MRFLPWIFFILILYCVSSQTLFYEAFSSITITSMEDWKTANAYRSFSDCGGTQIFGGFNTFGIDTKVMKLIQLPPHFEVQIKMKFWKIDTWDNEYFNIYIDGIQAYSQYYTSVASTSICGNIWGEEIQSITISIPHVYQSILILMTSSLDEAPSNESWGFRDFQLYLSLCPSDCLTCTSDDTKKDCISWSLLNSAFLAISSSNFSEEGWQIINGIQAYSDCNGIIKQIFYLTLIFVFGLIFLKPIHCCFIYIIQFTQKWHQVYQEEDLIREYLYLQNSHALKIVYVTHKKKEIGIMQNVETLHTLLNMVIQSAKITYRTEVDILLKMPHFLMQQGKIIQHLAQAKLLISLGQAVQAAQFNADDAQSINTFTQSILSEVVKRWYN